MGELRLHANSLQEAYEKWVIRKDGCWSWRGAHHEGQGVGYGQFNHKARKYYAHRASYELFVGPIPPGLTIDHLCRNPECSNPEHLDAVPLGVNILRGIGASAKNARKMACVHGHEFTEENTRHRRNGWRTCRTCHREQVAAAKARRKAAWLAPDRVDGSVDRG